MYYIQHVETLSRVTFSAPLSLSDREILTPDAIEFLTRLHTAFADRRRKLLARRSLVQHRIDMGILPGFDESTRNIREGVWRVRTAPADLIDRRVEITGPAGNAKMVINGLNSGANVYMADFEDAQAPTWMATLEGQRNLRDAVRRGLIYISPEGQKYTLGQTLATLMVRPRGWHLVEKHFCVDGEPIAASLFDFGLFMFHNARALLDHGSGPYFYLPKLENRFEAALWNDAFIFAEEYLGFPPCSVRATVLIETILAAFEMDEILYELRDRSVGLNCGRWDYIFSFIKKFNHHPKFVLPDRRLVTMDKGFLDAYVTLLIQTCHRRGAHAIGGMAANIPIKDDPVANMDAMEKVRQDKLREVRAGHDGTWVAHPGLVKVARDAFDSVLRSPNQLGEMRLDASVGRDDLLQVPGAEVTEAGLRTNIDVGVRYLEAWLSGTGAVPLYNLMEDTATAEISRAQVWQWLRHSVRMTDGASLTPSLFRKYFSEEMENIYNTVGPERYRRGQFDLASRLFFNLVHESEFTPFLTLKAYQYL
ncbi:MAG TPA: malate synthase A [Bacteroidota bacterium]|nr:malate synthase A [Bacteroidota bacterium]